MMRTIVFGISICFQVNDLNINPWWVIMMKIFSKSSQFTTFALAGLDVGNIMRIKGRQMWSGVTR